MRLSLFTVLFSLAFSSFEIDKTQSRISYIGSHPFHDWKGTTSKIEVNTNCEPTSIDCDVIVSVPVISFISGNDNRDSNMLFHVDAFSYPVVRISFSNLNVPELASNSENININGEIDFHGEKLIQEIPIFATINNSTLAITSNFHILLDSFDIDQPTLMMIPVKNQIKIDVKLYGEFIKK